MVSLSEFLLARVAEDEDRGRSLVAQWFDVGNACQSCGTDGSRVLAECKARRRIVEHHAPSRGDADFPLCAICTEVGPDAQGWPCLTLRLLALPHADHPDYREDW